MRLKLPHFDWSVDVVSIDAGVYDRADNDSCDGLKHDEATVFDDFLSQEF